jgi:hypothetical protein
MTQTKLNARGPAHRRAKTALALLTATAALAGGAEALAPSPAAAMINLGDCANLSGPALFECEMRGAGAGGGSGGGGGGSTSGDAGEGIIGEAIYVRDTRPSPTGCRQSWSCLPSTPGGGHQIGSDGARPRGPRPGHRPVRVGEVAKGKAKRWTKAECEQFKSGRLLLPSEQEIRKLEARIVSAQYKQTNLKKLLDQRRVEAERLAQEVQALKARHAASKDVLAAEQRYRAAMGGIPPVEREISAAADQFALLAKEHEALQLKRNAEAQALQKHCRDVHRISI